jgi:hypothetical protein
MKQYYELLLETQNGIGGKKLLQEPEQQTKNVRDQGNFHDSDQQAYGESSKLDATTLRLRLIDKLRKKSKVKLDHWSVTKSKNDDEPRHLNLDPKKSYAKKTDLEEAVVPQGDDNDFDGRDPPIVVIFRRKAIRNFPNGQRVALYYSQLLNKHLAVPYEVSTGKLKKPSKDDDLLSTV